MKSDRELIDEAIELMREVGHRHDLDRSGRDLLEFSLAFMRETWIASSGQKSSDPEDVFKAVQRGLRICAALAPEEGIENEKGIEK